LLPREVQQDYGSSPTPRVRGGKIRREAQHLGVSMETETPLEDGFSNAHEPGLGADASADDAAEETAEVEADAADDEVEAQSEAESPPAEEKDLDEKTDAFQGRIDKLTQSFRESERSADALREQNAELQQRLADVPPPVEPTKTLADFDYNEDSYRQYLFDEATTRATRAAEKVVTGYQAQSHDEDVKSKFASREKDFAGSVDDYQKVVYADDLKINQAMSVEIRESDIGPEMAYYLGKHPEEASQLSKQTPREVIRGMAILESTIRAEKAKGPKTVSDAPPPAGKVRGKSAATTPATTDPKSDKLSDEEWFKAEEKRQAKLRG